MYRLITTDYNQAVPRLIGHLPTLFLLSSCLNLISTQGERKAWMKIQGKLSKDWEKEAKEESIKWEEKEKKRG